MSGYILCTECRGYLGKYNDFIIAYEMNMKRLNSDLYNKVEPSKLETITNTKNYLEELFDILEIKNMCCRVHITTYDDFHKHIEKALKR